MQKKIIREDSFDEVKIDSEFLFRFSEKQDHQNSLFLNRKNLRSSQYRVISSIDNSKSFSSQITGPITSPE